MIDIKKCEICGKEYKNIRGLMSHVRQVHDPTTQQYYDTYLRKENEGFCLECGKPTSYHGMIRGYSKFCRCGCSSKNKDVQSKSKQTSLKRYGTEYPMQCEKIKNKSKETNLEKYGSEYYFSSDEGKQKIKDVLIEKYGVDNSYKIDIIAEKREKVLVEKYGKSKPLGNKEVQNKIKQINLEKYGTEYSFQSKEYQENVLQKIFLEKYGTISPMSATRDTIKVDMDVLPKEKWQTTRVSNGTWNSSSEEEIIYNELVKIFKDVKRQYKSELYPFRCDFYIPAIDTYIEYNGFFTHGGHPFNKDNQDDVERAKMLLEKGKEHQLYNTAHEVWTQSDPHKVETARKNKIKLLVFYNMKEVENWIKERKEQENG